MMAHSAAVCQCSSRTPPAVSRMSTPARLFETASSRTVTSRDHPPSCSRLCANANGYLNVCTPPASVETGLNESGFAASSTEFAGPGSLLLFSEIEFGAAFCCAKTPSAESTLAAANAAELTPRNPRRDKASFWTSSPMPPTFRNRKRFRNQIRSPPRRGIVQRRNTNESKIVINLRIPRQVVGECRQNLPKFGPRSKVGRCWRPTLVIRTSQTCITNGESSGVGLLLQLLQRNGTRSACPGQSRYPSLDRWLVMSPYRR